MRAVLLLNPRVPNLEHMEYGRQYAEASIGFDYNGDIKDNEAIAKHLHALADLLTAQSVKDKELI